MSVVSSFLLLSALAVALPAILPARAAAASSAVPAPFDAGDMAMIRQMRVLWLPVEAGGPVVDPQDIFGAADAKATAARLTGLPEKDATAKLRRLCVRLPDYITKARIEPGEYTIPAEFLERFQDPEFGVDAGGKFVLTNRHLILLQRGLLWDNRPDDGDEDFWPVQGINFKRPYGDFTLYQYEMAEILGEPYAKEADGRGYVKDRDKDAALERLHSELLGALQVVLLYGEMPAEQPGRRATVPLQPALE